MTEQHANLSGAERDFIKAQLGAFFWWGKVQRFADREDFEAEIFKILDELMEEEDEFIEEKAAR